MHFPNFSESAFFTKLFPTEQARTYATVIGLLLMMLFVTALSTFFFAGQSLRLDEAQSLWQTSRTPVAIFYVVAQDVHVPLYHELLHFWRLFVGNSVASDRMMSLVFYLISIPGMYLLGKKAYGRSIGIWGALLLTLSPFMNWYGNEIRMYTLFVMMVIFNQYFFIQLWKGKRADTWFGYAVTAVLGVFSHYFFFLTLAAQALFFFLNIKLFPKGSLWKFMVTAGIVVVSYIPWVTYVLYLGQAINQTPNLIRPSTVDLFSAFQQFIFGFSNNDINTVFLSLWPLALLFGFFALQRHRKLLPETEYLMLSVFVPVAIAFLGSYLITPVFVSRYLILTVPSLYLCLLDLFNAFTPRTSFIIRFGMVLLMAVMMGVEIFSPTNPVKEDYREVSNYLQTNAKSQDVVIISAPFTVYPIEYYYHGQAPVSTLPIWNQYAYGATPPFVQAQLPQQVASSTEDAQNVWLVLSYDQGYQKNIQTYFDDHFQKLTTITFSPGLTVQEYKLRYDTPLSGDRLPS
jgi:mannosyltransferase